MEIAYEILQDNFQIYISKSHRFGTDAFLLANFAAPKSGEIVFDLCSGCGIVAFLMAITKKTKKIYTLELQSEAVELAQRTVLENHLEKKVKIFCGDLKFWQEASLLGTLDLVTCNPPYKTAGSGLLCADKSEAIARHELACNISQVCAAASKLLKPRGRVCFCQRTDRLLDTLIAMKENKLEPKRLRFASHRPGAAPWLFLVEGRKNQSAYLKVEAPLFVEKLDGELTQEIKKIYGK